MNRYYDPVSIDFQSTYVPIPFQELVTIGRELNARRDKAQETLNATLNDWKKFYSPSQKDMEMWDSLTINNPAVRGVINKTVSDPNYIKTAEGQAAIAGLTNSVNVKALQQLQANAAQLTQYQKNYADMLSKGLQAWDPIDVTNYNTLGKGVLSNTSPMLRQEIVDVVKPYVDNMKDTFIEKKGGYLWSGVSKDMAENQVRANESAIFNSPQIQMHIKERQAAGETYETAVANVMNEVYRAANEFARRTPTADPLTLAAMKNSNSSGGSDHPDNTPMLFTNSIALTGRNATNQVRQDMFYQANPTLTELLNTAQIEYNNAEIAYNKAVQSGDTAAIRIADQNKKAAITSLESAQKDLAKQYELFSSQPMSDQLRNAYFPETDIVSLQRGANAMIRDFSGNNLVGAGWMEQVINGVGGATRTEDKKLIATDTSGLDLYTTYAANLARLDLSKTELSDNLIQKGLSENKYKGVVIQSADRIFSPGGSDNRAALTILIPESELFEGVNPYNIENIQKQLVAAQGQPVQYSGQTTTSSRRSTSDTNDIDNNDRDDSELKKVTITIGGSSSTKTGERYWAIPVIARLPNTGDGTSAEMFNQQSWQANMTDTQAGKLYSTNQMYNTAPLSR